MRSVRIIPKVTVQFQESGYSGFGQYKSTINSHGRWSFPSSVFDLTPAYEPGKAVERFTFHEERTFNG